MVFDELGLNILAAATPVSAGADTTRVMVGSGPAVAMPRGQQVLSHIVIVFERQQAVAPPLHDEKPFSTSQSCGPAKITYIWTR